MDPQLTILVTLVAYQLALVAIGFFAERRTRDSADFFIGGRRLGPVVAAISASASSSSAWTLLGVSGAAYAWGLSAVWIFPACVGGFCLNWYVLARPLRAESHRREAVTLTDILAGEEGRPLRRALQWTAGLIALFSLTAYVASQFQAAGKTFGETFGLSPAASMLVGSGVVVLYTLLGGFWAVSLTDTLQGLVMAASCIVLPLAALAAVGGPSALAAGIGEVEVAGYGSLVQNAGFAGGAGLVLGYLGIGLGYPGQPHVVNRLMALEGGESSLRLARRTAVVWAVLVYAGMLLLGWCGRVLFPGVDDREAVFILAARELLHPALAGLLVAAVLSAIMSTADSQLLVAGSAVSRDIIATGTERGSLFRSRSIVLAISLLALLAALFLTEDIFHNVLFAWTAMGAAFGPLLVVTVLWKPVPPARSLAAMLAGFSLAVVFYSLPATAGAWERLGPFFVALAICLLPERRSARLGRCASG